MIRAFAWVLTEVALGQKKTRARRGSSLGLPGGTLDGAEKGETFLMNDNAPSSNGSH